MRAWKRIFDVVASAIALIFLAPVLLAVAAAIWIESGRPILFRQERIGRGFLPFTLFKFRSMRPGTGPLVTAAGDERITRVGRFLRRTKIDELPQLWNVLRGDMSLVGPRPEVGRYVSLYCNRYQLVLSVPPGITDPASIKFRNEEAILAAAPDPERAYREVILPAKLTLSERYVSDWSFMTDIAMIVQTVAVLAGLQKPRRRWRKRSQLTDGGDE